MRAATDSSSVGKVLRGAAAALLFAATIIQPKAASAAYGGGGFHCGGGSRAGTASGFHGGGFHHGSKHFRGGVGFGGIYGPYWWGYGYPYFNYGYDANYPDHQYSGYDPACSYYGTCPDNGYGARPNAAVLVLLLRPRRLLSVCGTVQGRLAGGSGELDQMRARCWVRFRSASGVKIGSAVSGGSRLHLPW